MLFCSVAQLISYVFFVTTQCHVFCLVVSVDELIHSSDSETDDLVEEPASKRSRRAAREEKRSKAWLKEDEDIVDFLDPSAARKVVGKVVQHHSLISYVVCIGYQNDKFTKFFCEFSEFISFCASCNYSKFSYAMV